MTGTQELGAIVVGAIFGRAIWWLGDVIVKARHEAQAEQRRAELNRFIKDDYQRETQMERLRRQQTPKDVA